MTEPTRINITIDGRPVECEPGELVIEAAIRSGSYVPHFCWHPRMDPVGACRMCLVHIEPGPPKPQASCTVRVADGMNIRTQFTDPEIQKAQEGVIEFLLINHPLDCPICDRGGECPLQDQTQDYGHDDTRFIEPKRRLAKALPISPLVNLDQERCILCYRCTRFCSEVSGDVLLTAHERGPRAFIAPFEDGSFDSYFSGNTIEICPVGALTSRPYRFQARPWDIKQTPSVCNLCSAGCNVNLAVRVADGKLVRANQFTNEDVNEEWLCDKGRFGHAYVSSENRITQPWIRRDGELQPASWDDAFRVLEERLRPAVESGKADNAGLLIGASLTNEDAYVASKFARLVLRSNSVDHRLGTTLNPDSIIDSELTYDDVLSAPNVVVISADLREEVPMLFLRLRTAVTKSGTKLTLVHPRKIAGSEFAETTLPLWPGGEAALAAAIAAGIGSPISGGADAMAAAAGVESSAVTQLAATLQSEGTVVLLGPDVIANDSAVNAWRRLAELTGIRVGWLPRRANEVGVIRAGAGPKLLPGRRSLDNPDHVAEVAAAWDSTLPDSDGLAGVDILRRAAAGELDTLWLVGADVLDTPDAHLGQEALYNAKFVVLQTVVADDQIEFADVVLPAASFAEREGTLTNWEGREQRLHPAVDPPGSARADYAILAEVARRLGRGIGCRRISDIREEMASLAATDLPIAAPAAIDTSVAEANGRPLRLLTYRKLYDTGSRVRFTPEIAEMTETAHIEIHPIDADRLGVTDGSAVRVVSDHGSVAVTAVVTDTIRQGVGFLPYSQPHAGARELLSVGSDHVFVSLEPIE